MSALCYPAVLLTGFLIGSLPTGFLIARTRGIDIRQHGSGNIGATNVLRVLGKTLGYLVFAIDAAKGALAVLAGRWLAMHYGSPDQWQWAPILGGVACILGHNFTPWLGFKGGKGVATSAGVLLALIHPLILLGVVGIWWLVFKISRYVSLGSLAAALALPLLTWLFAVRGDPTRLPLFYLALAIMILLILRHRTNIVRLCNGSEARFEKRR